MSSRGKNPFIITFGKKPLEYIYRPAQTDEIISMFTGDPITNQVYIICGPRGTGKTVLLADVANQLEAQPDWVVIRCAPTSDILQVLAEGLQRETATKKISLSADVSIPAIGGIHLSQDETPASATFVIKDALMDLAKKHKKLLITVDEITNTAQMQDFVSNLQIWMGQDLPVFFLGTALYERIEELQNVPNLTFLYRAPKIELSPLDLVSISNAYEKTFGTSKKRSNALARLTSGYSFAFQALGYLYWNAMPVEDLNDILPDYDAMLSNAAYLKMWQELSVADRELCQAIATTQSDKVADIRKTLGGMDPNRFNQRRLRLKNRGLVDTTKRGSLTFSLPRFATFVKSAMDLYGV